MNVIRKYWNSIYHYVLLLIPGFCACAGIFWTVWKLLGHYPDIPWIKLLLFDFSQVLYLGISVYLIHQNKRYENYITNHLFHVKLFITLALVIQYNFILYLFPSDYVWECTFLFFAVSVFFYDSILTAVHIGSYIFSLTIATLLNPRDFLPRDCMNCEEIIAFRTVILLLTSVCVLLIVYFVERFLIQAQESSEENKELLKKQLEYYQNCDILDTELRKFRHDIKNHFICMEHLFQNGNIEDLQSYFEDLNQSFSFQERIYFSGNHIIDAVLNHDLPHHCLHHVNIIVYGSLLENCAVSSMDLCTIFSNMLSNAIASANRCDASMRPELSIQFMTGTHYFSICVTNSICPQDALDLNQKSKKRENRNHGFGLNKIKEVIEKYNGNFEQTLQGQTMVTEVYLPLYGNNQPH